MNAINVHTCKVGRCYDRLSDGMYLGSYKGMGRGYLREEGPGAGTYSPIYLFENATLKDTYPVDMVIEVGCKPTEENRKRKKNALVELRTSPAHGTFPGGINYQKAKNNFENRTLQSKRRNNSRRTRKRK